MISFLLAPGVDDCCDGSSKGRNIAPNRMQLSTMPPIIKSAPRHPKAAIKYSVRGAKTKVPKPEPHTAIPVANDLLASNHVLTLTMAGR